MIESLRRINDRASPIRSRREGWFVSVAERVKLFGVEFDSLVFFDLGDRKFDDNRDDSCESRRFSDPVVSELSDEGFELLEGGTAIVLSKRLLIFGGVSRLSDSD